MSQIRTNQLNNVAVKGSTEDLHSANHTVGLLSLGCKVNFYESECMASQLTAAGFEVVDFDKPADAYLINSCTVTSESDRKVMQVVRRAMRQNPSAFIVVTGCMAETGLERLSSLDFSGAIVGNYRKSDSIRAIIDHFSHLDENNSRKITVSVPALERTQGIDIPWDAMTLTKTSHARAIVKIEDGCNSHCAYCIICKARGPARSKPEADILAEVSGLAERGYSEVVLTGIELSSYDGDIPDLIRKISHISGIKRVRLGSLDPAYVKKEWSERLSECKVVAPHFHISLQSGSTTVLNRMKRKYNAKMALENIMALKKCFPNAMFFADVIVGFPGETEEEFQETIDFIQKVKFLHLHIFPYSIRKGTVAAEMADQVPNEVKHGRARRLADIQAKIKSEILNSFVGQELEMLVEGSHKGVSEGHSAEFIELTLPGKFERGAIVKVRATKATADGLIVELI